MRDHVTQMGTQSMCALYKPTSSPLQVDNRPIEHVLQLPQSQMGDNSPNNTGSEPDWEADIPSPKHARGSLLDQQCLKVRDRGKSLQRRWRQKLKVRLDLLVFSKSICQSRDCIALASSRQSLQCSCLRKSLRPNEDSCSSQAGCSHAQRLVIKFLQGQLSSG